MSERDGLRIWLINDGAEHWYAATSADEAGRLHKQNGGDEDLGGWDVREVAGSEFVSVSYDDFEFDSVPDGCSLSGRYHPYLTINATASAWARWCDGPTLLGSENF